MNVENKHRKLSVDRMDRVILEKIPLEERLRAVYLPIVTMDCACYMADDLLESLRTFRLDSTKKSSRTIRNCVEEYRNENYRTLHSDLYKELSIFTRNFYDSLTQDMTIYRLQYRQAMLDRNIQTGEEIAELVSLVYVVRELIRFAVDIDRKFSERMTSLLNIPFNIECEWFFEMLRALRGILDAIKIPDDLKTYQTDMAFRVLKNKINSMKV